MMLSVLYILVLFGVAVFVENDIIMCTMFLSGNQFSTMCYLAHSGIMS